MVDVWTWIFEWSLPVISVCVRARVFVLYLCGHSCLFSTLMKWHTALLRSSRKKLLVSFGHFLPHLFMLVEFIFWWHAVWILCHVIVKCHLPPSSMNHLTSNFCHQYPLSLWRWACTFEILASMVPSWLSFDSLFIICVLILLLG